MRNNKITAKIFLFIIAFSFAYSLLPIVSVFASNKNAANENAKVKTEKNTLTNYSNSLKADTKPQASGSAPVKDLSRIIRDGIGELDQEDYKVDIKILKNMSSEDLCDRSSHGALVTKGQPNFLQVLFNVVGDSKGYTDINRDIVRKNYDDFIIKPEMVPATGWDCFPDIWKAKYSEDQWSNLQDALGTKKCNTFSFSCKIEQTLKNWIRAAIVTGLTWIIDIATGSGTGEAAEACRPYRGEGGSTGNQATYSTKRGFPDGQVAKCNKFLNSYYALDNKEIADDSEQYALGKSGLELEPKDANGNYDRAPRVGSGDSSINSDSESLFYGKSSQLGYIIAIGMVIGAVIQAMVQSKPVIAFKVIFILVPLFGLSLMLAPILTKYFMQIIDGVSYYFADNSAADINNVATAFGTTVGSAASTGITAAQGTVNDALHGSIMDGVIVLATGVVIKTSGISMLGFILSKGMLIIAIVGGFFVLQALALWALMMFREASILLVLALLPIALSMNIWPSLAKITSKFIKLLMALIFAKIPIVMAISMGLNMMSEWVQDHIQADGTLGYGEGGLRIFIMAMAIFMLALAAPTFVISLFDAVGEMAGSLGRDMHKGISRSAAQFQNVKALGAGFGLNKNKAPGMPGLSGKLPGSDSESPTTPSKPPTPGGPPGTPPTSGGPPGAPGSTDPAGDSGKSAKEPKNFFQAGMAGRKEARNQAKETIRNSTDDRGRPNSTFFDGGHDMVKGAGQIAGAQARQNWLNSKGGASKLATFGNKLSAAKGAAIYTKGASNASSSPRRKMAQLTNLNGNMKSAWRSIK